MEIGININGDLSFSRIEEVAPLIERLGFTHIWVGESAHFKHPFPVIASIAEWTSCIRVGSGIISYFFNRPLHIRKAFETLVEVFGSRFAIALAPGDVNSLRAAGIEPARPLKRLEETLSYIRESGLLGDTPVYVGASGPKMIALGSRLAEGVLLNYAHPEYVEWALEQLSQRTYVGVYAPALMVPDKKRERAALFAAAYVAAGSNPVFQRQFELEEEVASIRRILARGDFSALADKRELLFERFLIAGSEREIMERLRVFAGMDVDQVILGAPFAYNVNALDAIARAL